MRTMPLRTSKACWGVLWFAALAAQGAEGQTPVAIPTPTERRDETPPTRQAKLPHDEMANQEKDILEMSIEELMTVQVVVTASRRTQSISSVPRAISVVTADDIRSAGARSIPDALRLVAGVDVADLSYGNAAVAPRGFHGFLSRQVLVLVDGRQIFDSLFGGTLWGSWPFQLEDIERIEVVRGPTGVTWGANAVNGVINIITKDPADQLGVTTTVGGGSRGANKEHVGYGVQDGKLRFRVSAEYESSDGFRTAPSIFAKSSDDYNIGRLGIHAIYDWGKADKLTLSAGSGVLDGGFAMTPLAGFGAWNHPGSQASFVLAKWLHQVAEDDYYEVTAFINDFWGSPATRQQDYRYQQLALQLSRVYVPRENHRLVWGIDTRADLLDATNADPQLLSKDYVSSGTVGLHVQDEWKFAPRWTLNLGASMAYDSYGGFQPSTDVAIIHDIAENAQVFGSVSRAFQMPPSGLRFLEMPVANGLAWAVGDRGVDPETLIAYQLGARWRHGERLHNSVALYWNDYDELTTLSPRIGPPGLIALDFGNRAAAASYGLEFESRYVASPKLTFLANYTYQELNWDASVPYNDKDLISLPRNKAMIGARYNASEDLLLSSYLYYVDATHAPDPFYPFVAKGIDPYLRLDIRAEYKFWNDRASIAFGVQNLLDPEHPEGGTLFLDNTEVPRMFFAECRISIP